MNTTVLEAGIQMDEEITEGFYNILGYDDIRNIVRRALSSEENYYLLLCGPPASTKTLFLHRVLEMVSK